MKKNRLIDSLMNRSNDPNEDQRVRGTFWTYWDRSLHEYTGPEVGGSVLAYTTQSLAMGKVTPGKPGFPVETQKPKRRK